MVVSLSFSLSLSFSFSLISLASILVILNYSRWNIFATIFLVVKIESLWTTNSMIFELKQCWPTIIISPMVKSSSIKYLKNQNVDMFGPLNILFFPAIRCWNLSISNKMIFPLPENVSTIFFFFFFSV